MILPTDAEMAQLEAEGWAPIYEDVEPSDKVEPKRRPGYGRNRDSSPPARGQSALGFPDPGQQEDLVMVVADMTPTEVIAPSGPPGGVGDTTPMQEAISPKPPKRAPFFRQQPALDPMKDIAPTEEDISPTEEVIAPKEEVIAPSGPPGGVSPKEDISPKEEDIWPKGVIAPSGSPGGEGVLTMEDILQLHRDGWRDISTHRVPGVMAQEGTPLLLLSHDHGWYHVEAGTPGYTTVSSGSLPSTSSASTSTTAGTRYGPSRRQPH